MALKLFAASAGTGKTWTICDEVAKAIAGGLDPARLVATTFTRKAAGELKARLQRRLLEEKGIPAGRRWALLDRLELAAVGTVHSVGLRFLQRSALAAGLSPRMIVIGEEDGAEGEGRHLREFLTERPPEGWSELADLGVRLSLDPAREVLALLAAKRANALDHEAFRASMRSSLRDWLAVIGAPDRALVTDFAGVKSIARGVLSELEKRHDNQKNTANAIDKVRRLATRGPSAWCEVAKADTIKPAKKLEPLMKPLHDLAAAIRRMPAFHADVQAWYERVTEAVCDLEVSYAEYKAERGQLDFVDLEERFLDLLRTRPEAVAGEIDFLAVDEFQDTNPIQLAIFKRLADVAGNVLWVGDRKQTIYGFRGADAELVDKVWQSARGERRPLGLNYRSQAGLVQAVGAFFAPAFGDEVRVEAVERNPPEPRAVERWVLSGGKVAEHIESLVAGLRRMLADDGLRKGDIAVLVRSNARAGQVAEGLAAAGVDALLPRGGLLSTREGASIHAAIRLLVDRRDGVAAAELLHLLDTAPTEATPGWFAARRAEVEEDGRSVPFSDHPLLASVFRVPAATFSPSTTVRAVQAALDLPGAIAGWGSPVRRAANLDAVASLALAYEEECARSGRAATLAGLAAHLDGLAEDGRDAIAIPDGIDAIQVLTYHGAKGLEWPIVVCMDLDKRGDPRLFSPDPEGGDPASDNPLAGRTLRYWAWPFDVNDFAGGRPHDRAGLLTDATASPKGADLVAREAREDQRLLYVGMTRAKRRLILAQTGNDAAWLDAIGGSGHADTVFGPCEAKDYQGVERRIPKWKTSMVSRLVSPTDAPPATPPRTKTQWIDDAPAATRPALPRRWSSPSEAVGTPKSRVVQVLVLPGARPILPAGNDERNLGNALHAYFAAVPGLSRCDRDRRIAVASGCLDRHQVTRLDPAVLVDAGDRLLEWARSRWPGAEHLTEVPVEGPRAGGGGWRGTIDWLVRREGTPLAILDHKMAGGPAGDPKDVVEHLVQLEAYREAVAAQGEVDLLFHLPLAGKLVMCR